MTQRAHTNGHPRIPCTLFASSCLVSLCLARCPESSFTKTHRKMLPPNLPPRRESPSPSANPSSDSDDAIRLTDDDAASSRLYVSRLFFSLSTSPDHTTCSSAAQVGYLQDPFAPLLYKAPMPQSGGFGLQGGIRARKPPLINVGTHHRTWGIDLLVDRFLQSGGKQVVSLGAGSDTRFWRLMVGSSCIGKTWKCC